MWEVILVAWRFLIRLLANPFRPTQNEYEIKLLAAQDLAIQHIQERLDEERAFCRSAVSKMQQREVYLAAELQKSKEHRERCERELHELKMVEQDDKRRITELESKVVQLRFRVRTLEKKTGIPPGSVSDVDMPKGTEEAEGGRE